MDDGQIAPFLKYQPTDKLSNTPSLTLSLSLGAYKGSLISKNNADRCVVEFTLHRGIDDGQEEPCSFFWSGDYDAFGIQGFLLLRHTADGELEKVNVSSESWRTINLTELEIGHWKHGVWELMPGKSTTFARSFPQSWLDAMVKGERYELVWPGGDILWWSWGTIKDNQGAPSNAPRRAILPGAPRVSFTVVDDPPPEPLVVYETPLPKWPAVPTLGTPVLSVTLRGPFEKKRASQCLEAEYVVTYIGITQEDPDGDIQPATRPIIFDAFHMLVPDEETFCRRGSGDWACCETEAVGYPMADALYDGGGPVKIGTDKCWISLAPGEPWISPLSIYLSFDKAVGDRIRCQLHGHVFKVWNWGSKKDHAESVLSSRYGCEKGFQAPGWTDRPPIVMPASNLLDFTIVD